MENWRLLERIDTNGAMQMAIDESMLDERINGSIPNTLRFFTWKPSCITIGYFQSLEQEVDTKKANALGVDVVRRYTGGGAVFHENELTYSVAILEKDVSSDIIGSYEKICGAIIEGLNSLGLKAEFKPINDIIVNGKKISGNAQTRKQGVILQHGTILLDVDVKKMFSLLKVPDEKIRDKLIATVEERVTCLNKESSEKVSIDAVQEAIQKGFEKKFNINLIEGKLNESELKNAEKLCAEKYSSKEWVGLR